MWFYDIDADGWSLDDKRTPLLPEAKLGCVSAETLTAEEHAKNNLPDGSVAVMHSDNVGKLKALEVLGPPVQLEHEFARRVEAVDKLKAAHRASLAQLDALFSFTAAPRFPRRAVAGY